MGLGDYIRETRAELRHISWPTRKQSMNFTALVVGVSLLVAILLGIFDIAFDLGLKELLSKGGFRAETVIQETGNSSTTQDTLILGEPESRQAPPNNSQ